MANSREISSEARKTPFDILENEHILARDIVVLLDWTSGSLKDRKPISLVTFGELLEAIEKTMHLHHKKEMDVFSCLAKEKKVSKKDLLDILIEEHNLGEAYLANARRLSARARKGREEKYELLPFHLNKYARLLESHIEKEERGFFPLVKSYIKGRKEEEMVKNFAKIGRERSARKALEIISAAKNRCR